MFNYTKDIYRKGLVRGLISLLVLSSAISLNACGYTLVGRGRALPTKFKTISIPIMENKTKEDNLDTLITAAIRREFLVDGRLKVVQGDKADLVLKGEIVGYTHAPVSFGTNTDEVTYNVNIAVSVDIRDQLDDKYNIKQTFAATKDYKTMEYISGSDINKERAIKEIGQTLGQNMVSIIIDNF
ncbi:MAG: LptE family protein [Nitrospinota bacterium]|nr:hypothetical protein [Nitrospinota bacterium]